MPIDTENCTRALLVDLIPDLDMGKDDALEGTLSKREQNVLQQVALGCTSAEIAERLNLSFQPVDTYTHSVKGIEKLGLRNLVDRSTSAKWLDVRQAVGLI